MKILCTYFYFFFNTVNLTAAVSDLPSKDILCPSWAKSNPKQEQLWYVVTKPWAVFGAGATAYPKLLVVGGKCEICVFFQPRNGCSEIWAHKVTGI